MTITDGDLPHYLYSNTNVHIGECGIYEYVGTSAGSWTMPVRAPSYTAGQQRRMDASVYWIYNSSTAAALTLNRSSSDNFRVGGTTSATLVLYPGESAMIFNNGSFWSAMQGAALPGIFKKIFVSSAGTVTLSRQYSSYVSSAAGATTWTLPAITNNTGLELEGFNRGAGNITLQRAGSDQLYGPSGLVTSIAVIPGNSFRVLHDGTYWLVTHNGG